MRRSSRDEIRDTLTKKPLDAWAGGAGVARIVTVTRVDRMIEAHLLSANLRSAINTYLPGLERLCAAFLVAIQPAAVRPEKATIS
jgi:hypothetical protein